MEFERRDDTNATPKAADGNARGRQLVDRLQGRGDVAMTTDEIMALTRDGRGGPPWQAALLAAEDG